MKRIIFALAILLPALRATRLFAADHPADAVAVRIVPSRTDDKGGRSITLFQPAQHFHVVVTNVSREPVRLWREWCSWGYHCLSFVVVEDGRNTAVTKAEISWRKNYPDSTTLAPGEHMVFEVTFDKSVWPNAPVPDNGKSRVVRMKAVFAVPADEDARKLGVWTGEVSSPVEAYTVYR